MKKGFVNWSGGKDALMALHQLKKDDELECRFTFEYHQ